MSHSRKRKKRIRVDQLAQVGQHLGHLLDAGFPLVPSLRLLQEQKVLRPEEAHGILVDLDNGRSLSQALAGAGFPSLFVSFIRASEEHGNLAFGLKQCESYYSQQYRFRRDISQAVAYPLVVLVLVGFSFFFLMTTVVPRFRELYEAMGLELPAYTQMVLMIHGFLPVIGVAGAGMVLFILILRISVRYLPSDRQETVEEWWRRLPGLRSFYSLRFTHYLSVQLGTMLQSGVPLLRAVEIMKELSPWRPLARSVARIRAGLLQGQSFHRSVEKEGDRFLPALARLAALGEESGRLDQSLLTLGKGAEMMIRERLKRWTKSLEPILIFIIGLFMAATVIAMFLPMLHLVQAM
ncbi:type II secretion system F family protein [Desmospora profundinema]|uniref:Type II secretory pathway component PulF n=1 Tax=Desmospora profundinema TaxID=1571184 RepID=A0ABU1IJI6_9BACL|nr:type II secretion system F family protein [Desmospora profundinema]MDR6224942.1 type II secretory pathway component PulF [Desmospora profundinema]